MNLLVYLRGLAAATTFMVATTISSVDLDETMPQPAIMAPQRKPDLLIIAMSHQPEFCYQHSREGFPGCQHPTDYIKTHLTIHGLWPEYKDGTWPSMCTRERLDPKVVTELKEGLEMYWPNVKESETDPNHDEFWSHEWSKHGTCSGLSQEAYFRSALSHYLPTPEMIQSAKTVEKDVLLQAYGGANKVVTVCSAKKYLSEVRSCLEVGQDGLPLGQVECPTKVLEEDNCGDVITIAKFPKQKEGSSSLRGSMVSIE